MKKFIKSFYYAGRGIFSGVRERNMKIHITLALAAVVMGFYFRISAQEWTAVILSISIVLAAELFNTAIEDVCDVNRNELNVKYESTGRARDTAAGAVLISALGAGLVGIIIFLPKVLSLL